MKPRFHLVLFLFLVGMLFPYIAQATKQPTTSIPKDCNQMCQEMVAQTLLKSALDFAAVKQFKFATDYLKNIIRLYPATKAALLAKQHMANKKIFLDTNGRVEFVVFSTLYGLGLGAAIPAIMDANEAWIWGLSIILMGGASITGSLLGTSGLEMTAGQGSIISSSTFWGLWTGIAISVLGEFNSVQSWIGTLAGVSAVAYGASLAVGRFVKITAGQSAFGTSFGLWAGGLLTLGLLAGKVTDFKAILGSAWGVSTAGFVGGMFWQKKLKFSRARTSLISLGGILGGALGVGVTLLMSSVLTDATFIYITTMFTSIGGIALTTYLTRNMKVDPELDKNFSLAGSLLHYNRGRWMVGTPVPSIIPLKPFTGQDGYEISVPVLSGKW